jgi:hypothetical protein
MILNFFQKSHFYVFDFGIKFLIEQPLLGRSIALLRWIQSSVP